MSISNVSIGARGASVGSAANVSTVAGNSTGGANSTGSSVVSFDRGVNITSVTDNVSGSPNNWQLIRVVDGGIASAKLAHYKCEGMVGRAGHVLTYTFSGPAFAVAHPISEIIGSVGAITHDAAASVGTTITQASANATYTATSGTLAQENSLVIVGFEQNQGTVGAYAFSPQALISQEPDTANFWTSGVAAQVVVPTTAVTTSVTRADSTPSTSAIFIDVFKEAAGGPLYTLMGQA